MNMQAAAEAVVKLRRELLCELDENMPHLRKALAFLELAEIELRSERTHRLRGLVGPTR